MLEFETLHHVAISVSDLARAKRFYGEILGLEEIARPNFPFAGAWYRIVDRELHLIVSRDPSFRNGRRRQPMRPISEPGHPSTRPRRLRSSAKSMLRGRSGARL